MRTQGLMNGLLAVNSITNRVDTISPGPATAADRYKVV